MTTVILIGIILAFFIALLIVSCWYGIKRKEIDMLEDLKKQQQELMNDVNARERDAFGHAMSNFIRDMNGD